MSVLKGFKFPSTTSLSDDATIVTTTTLPSYLASHVTANPSGTATGTLTTLLVDGTIYSLAASGGSGSGGSGSISSIDQLNGGTLLSSTSIKGAFNILNSSDTVVSTIDQNGYVTGKYLKTTDVSDSANWTDVFVNVNATVNGSNPNGVLYKRSKANLKTDLGIPSGTVATESYVTSAISNLEIQPITYSALKTLRDTNQLVPGVQYRITDYQCTTSQTDTRSAGHQFDIIVVADDNHTLNEVARAALHSPIYDITFSDNVTLKCYLYSYEENSSQYWNIVNISTGLGYSAVSSVNVYNVDTTNKTASSYISSADLDETNVFYDYFQYSKLNVWELKYCLDNDITRFY